MRDVYDRDGYDVYDRDGCDPPRPQGIIPRVSLRLTGAHRMRGYEELALPSVDNYFPQTFSCFTELLKLQHTAT